MKKFARWGDRSRRRSIRLAGLVVLSICLFAVPVGAGSAATGGKTTSAGDQYKSVPVVKAAVVKQVKYTTTKPKPKPAVAATTSGQLPFTGVSLAGAAVLGIGLTGLGLMLRRRERRDES